MPRPAHMRVTFSGIFGATTGPLEEWAFNVNFPTNRWTSTSAAVPVQFATLWQTHCAPLHTSLVTLTKVRLASVDGEGHVQRSESGAYLQADATPTVPGTNAATFYYPPQVAVAVSLISSRAGASGKGRFFIPSPGATIATDLRLTTTSATAILNGYTSLLSAMKAYNESGSSFSGNGGPVVVSSKGYTSPVVQLRVGRALDTIRSRRGDLPEGYMTSTI